MVCHLACFVSFSALSSTLEYVKLYTSTCQVTESEEVNTALYQLISVYQPICPHVVLASICDMTDLPADNAACTVSSDALDLCDATPVILTCS